MRSIAIESYLIDDLPAAAPPGFNVLRSVGDSVPRQLAIADGWSAIVQIPTGLARPWIETDPLTIIASSSSVSIPHPSPDDSTAHYAPRLIIRCGGPPLGALPLVAGSLGTFHAPSALLELMPLAWEIRAAAMRGGSPGSLRIDLAWRSRVFPGGVLPGS